MTSLGCLTQVKCVEGRQFSLFIAFFRELSHSESKNEKKFFRFFGRKMTKSGMANTGGSRRSPNFTFDMITFRIGPFRNFFKKFSFFDFFFGRASGMPGHAQILLSQISQLLEKV